MNDFNDGFFPYDKLHIASEVTWVSICRAISLHDVYFPDGFLMTCQ